MKIVNQLFEKSKSFQLLVVMYKRAKRIYVDHGVKKGAASIIKCCSKSFFSTFGLNIIYYDNNKVNQIIKLLDKMTIHHDGRSSFYYWIDEKLYLVNRHKLTGNMPVDYSFIIDNSLNEIKQKIIASDNSDKRLLDLLAAIERYIDRICIEIKKTKGKNSEIISNLQSMKTRKAKNLQDALQRILFWNSLLHQTGHTLVGLGRLDYILDRFPIDDIKYVKSLLREFCKTLHSHYEYKSQALLGDTGQIIILGGLKNNKEYFYNEYTKLFIDVIKELNLPDPKIMLRVSKLTPDVIIDKSLDCNITGNGSPLYSNDDVVIPLLKEFGYSEEDVYNYGVSACWEPVIIGKSMDQNNLYTISFAKIFNEALAISIDKHITSINGFLKIYYSVLRKVVNDVTGYIDMINWEESPITSLFFDNCRCSGVDISKGGAKYNNLGILTDGLANTVNSILNLNNLVFKSQKMTLQQVGKVLKKNYNGYENIRAIASESDEYFGQDSKRIIGLTNYLFNIIKNSLRDKTNRYGGKFKIGLSSPGYLMDGKKINATLDGRRKKEPLSTHISCDKNLSYTELISFASQIDYSPNGFNGNVIDLMVTPDFIRNNKDKFILFIKLGIVKGLFQMQMNVVSSDILIDAKKHPEKYRNLIGRGWGFSAYYVDLPEAYKNMLIKRALRNEGKRL